MNPGTRTSGTAFAMTKKVLIYRLGQLGDTVIALPSLWAIRRAFPDAHISYLSSEASVAGQTIARSVLPQHGIIDEWLPYKVPGHRAVVQLFKFWSNLRKGRFDLLVYLVPRGRTRWQVKRDMVFFRSAGIRNVIGHLGLEPLPPRTKGKALPVEEHEAVHLMTRLARSGLATNPEEPLDMNLALTQEEHAAAEKWLQAAVPHSAERRLLIGIGPGSKWPSKIWPSERFEELGRRLTQELQVYPIVFGSPAERQLAERLTGAWRMGANGAGGLSIRTASAVLARCQLYVGNDTGTMHLAAAVGTPCVAIMSAQDWPGRWNPYGPSHIVLRRSVPCEGCFLSVCDREALRCLREISVEDVLTACKKVLERSALPCHAPAPITADTF